MDNNDSVPIIKKIVKGHGGHHGGAWKVAYADFVTAMMALFIVLWILGQSDAVKKSVSSYFKDPIGFSKNSKILIEGRANPMPDVKEWEEKMKREVEKNELEKIKEEITKEIASDTELKSLANQVRFEITKEGLRIELTDSEHDVFFEIGTAELNGKAQKLIEKIGLEINKLPNRMVVEGHTDSRSFHNIGTGYTNFELSAERALTAKRELVKGGLNEHKIDEVRGYADTKLRDQENPLSFVNRRISITVRFNK